MKYAVYAALTFAAFMLFVPLTGTTKIRNLPLLIAILTCIGIYLIVRAAKRISGISKIKRYLCGHGYNVTHSTVIHDFFAIKGKYDIVATRAKNVYNITFLKVKKASWHAHFENVNKLEYYITSHVVVDGGKTHASRVSKATSTRCVARKRLPFDIKEGEKHVLVLDKTPSLISDSKCGHLFPGSMIESKVLLTTVERLDEISKL